VETRDAQQAAHDVGEVRTKDATIRVELVDYDVLQVGKEPRPPGVVRHDARVQHVRVREEHSSALPRRSACIVGGVAIVGDGADVQVGVSHQRTQRFLLIARERLGWKQVEGCRCRVGGEGLEDREVVAKALPRGGRSCDDHVLAPRCELERARLVAIQVLDTPPPKRADDPLGQLRRHLGNACRLRFDCVAPSDVPPRAV